MCPFHALLFPDNTFCPFAECILAILLFALSTELVSGMNTILRVISSKLSTKHKDDPRLVKLDEETMEIRCQMDTLSPTSDFAQYFKLERLVNKLGEERKKIASTRKISSAYPQAFAVGLRAVAFFVSLALAFHSSTDTHLFTIPSDHFYPFNFLLDFPFSIVNFQQAVVKQSPHELQPIGLFSFSIISLFTWNLWKNTRIELSKKIE